MHSKCFATTLTVILNDGGARFINMTIPYRLIKNDSQLN